VLHCVTVCYSVLPSSKSLGSVIQVSLQCVAVAQCVVTVFFILLRCVVVVCCSVLQCVLHNVLPSLKSLGSVMQCVVA